METARRCCRSVTTTTITTPVAVAVNVTLTTPNSTARSPKSNHAVSLLPPRPLQPPPPPSSATATHTILIISNTKVEQETQARHVRWIVARRDRLSNRLYKITPTFAVRQSSVTKHVENGSNNYGIMAAIYRFLWQWLNGQSYHSNISEYSLSE